MIMSSLRGSIVKLHLFFAKHAHKYFEDDEEQNSDEEIDNSDPTTISLFTHIHVSGQSEIAQMMSETVGYIAP